MTETSKSPKSHQVELLDSEGNLYTPGTATPTWLASGIWVSLGAPPKQGVRTDRTADVVLQGLRMDLTQDGKSSLTNQVPICPSLAHKRTPVPLCPTDSEHQSGCQEATYMVHRHLCTSGGARQSRADLNVCFSVFFCETKPNP